MIDDNEASNNLFRCDCKDEGKSITPYKHVLGCSYLIWYSSELSKKESKDERVDRGSYGNGDNVS